MKPHTNDITLGALVIRYAPAASPIVEPESRNTWRRHRDAPEGWVLPGGKRTQDKSEAVEYAEAVNRELYGRGLIGT